MTSAKLYHVGDTFVTEEIESNEEEKKETVVLIKEIELKEYFNDIVFSKQMIKFHMPHVYLELFEGKKLVFD